MTSQPATRDAPKPPIEIKGSSFTLPVLRLLAADLEAVSQALGERLGQAPRLLRDAPLVVDLSALRGQTGAVDFALLIGTLRSHGLIPIAVTGGDEAQNELAQNLDLAVLAHGTPRQPGTAPPPPRARGPVAGARVVAQPVRSGQRVYASGGDLVVLGPVSSGAEVYADGHVHVYGALRGRALAGVKGNPQARVFCQGLDAELVAVSGIYKLSEDISEALRGRPAQAFLRDRQLCVEAL